MRVERTLGRTKIQPACIDGEARGTKILVSVLRITKIFVTTVRVELTLGRTEMRPERIALTTRPRCRRRWIVRCLFVATRAAIAARTSALRAHIEIDLQQMQAFFMQVNI